MPRTLLEVPWFSLLPEIFRCRAVSMGEDVDGVHVAQEIKAKDTETEIMKRRDSKLLA